MPVLNPVVFAAVAHRGEVFVLVLAPEKKIRSGFVIVRPGVQNLTSPAVVHPGNESRVLRASVGVFVDSFVRRIRRGLNNLGVVVVRVTVVYVAAAVIQTVGEPRGGCT